MSETLTPTQDLCMEVLAARHRLGEPEWPFDTRLSPAIHALEERGLVESRSGIVDRTVLVSLTRTGREHALDENYRPRPTQVIVDRQHVQVALEWYDDHALEHSADLATYRALRAGLRGRA